MKLLRIVNKSGLFLRDDFVFDNDTEIGIDTEPARGLIYPKWDFAHKKWTENGVNPFPSQIIEGE